MIQSVKGTLTLKEPTLASVQVGGIGLSLRIPLSTFSKLPETPNPVQLFTYLYVREDQLKLYGFACKTECELFKLLLGVTKIGPGVALQVLSSCSVDEFKQLIAAGEIKTLSSLVKGVGKKTAERMILELKDKIGDFAQEDAALGDSAVAPDAVKALVELGSSPVAARKEVKKAIEQNGPGASADTILRTVFDNR